MAGFSGNLRGWFTLGASGLLPVSAIAHELWVLTPEQERFWRAQPSPRYFTEPTALGLATLAVFVAIVGVALILHFHLKPRWLVRISGQKRHYADYIPLVLRLTAGWALITSAYGLETRAGSQILRHPVLFAPDLRLCSGGEAMPYNDALVWFVVPETFIGALLVFGLWVRGAAFGLIGLVSLGFYHFGTPMLAYAPVWLGGALYLLVRGAGPYAVACFGAEARLRSAGFEPNAALRHAQFMLRVLLGLNILYLGIRFKVMEPSLAMGVLVEGKIPIFSLFPDYGVFLLACIEVTFGLLLMLGIGMRPASLVLLGAFIFFATFLDESYTLHMIYYGALIAMLLGGPGRLRAQGRYQEDEVPPLVLDAESPRLGLVLRASTRSGAG